MNTKYTKKDIKILLKRFENYFPHSAAHYYTRKGVLCFNGWKYKNEKEAIQYMLEKIEKTKNNS